MLYVIQIFDTEYKNSNTKLELYHFSQIKLDKNVVNQESPRRKLNDKNQLQDSKENKKKKWTVDFKVKTFYYKFNIFVEKRAF